MSNDIPVKEISEILDVVSSKVPSLISNLIKTVYSEEAAGNMGRAIGTLYKELVTSGIPQDVALKMATDYMVSMKDMLGKIQKDSMNYSSSTKE
jgi:hypothetical protein